MQPLYEIIILYADLLKYESYRNIDISKDRVLKSLDFFVRKGYVRVDGDTCTVVNKEQFQAYVDFFKNLIHPLIDTYMITLTAVLEMCGKNLVVKFKKLAKEIHVGIKRLYLIQMIPHLSSCLLPTIHTALERFE